MIPLILNIARLASTVFVAESRAAALAGVRAQLMSTGQRILVGEALATVGKGTKWESSVRRVVDAESGDPFLLLDLIANHVSEGMSDADRVLLDKVSDYASDMGLEVRASVSAENLSPSETMRLLRASRSAEEPSDTDADSTVVTASKGLLLYTVAQSGALVLAGAAMGAVALGMTKSEWARLRAIADPKTLSSIRQAAGRYTTRDSSAVSPGAGVPLALPLANARGVAIDPGLRAKVLAAVPPSMKDDAAALMAHLAAGAVAAGVAPELLDTAEGLLTTESIRSAIPPAVMMTVLAVTAPLSRATPLSGPIRMRDLTSAGIPASGLWDPHRKIDGVAAPHKGADIPVSVGTQVLAVGAGRVRWNRFDTRGGGNSMDVLYDRVNSVSPCLVTYRHLSKFQLTEGETFERGVVLALSGNTAGNPSSGRRGSTGAHLHVEVRVPEMAYMSEPALRDAKVPGKHWKLVPTESVIANA